PPTTSIYYHPGLRALHPFPTRRSSDLSRASSGGETRIIRMGYGADELYTRWSQRSLVRWKEFCKATHQKLFLETGVLWMAGKNRSEEHTSELQSLAYLVCRLLLEKKKD